MRVSCPMCGAPMRTDASTLEAPTVRTAYVSCTNPACGCQAVAHLAIDRILYEGRQPRPGSEITLAIPPGAIDAAVARCTGGPTTTRGRTDD